MLAVNCPKPDARRKARRPSVDVVMVTYNQAPYVAKAIRSALDQTGNFDLRLIVSDDASTDGTIDIVASLAAGNPEQMVFLQAERNAGVVGNYRRALGHVTATYLAILEGDDFWQAATKLQEQVAVLEADPEVGLVHSAYDVLDESTQTVRPCSPRLVARCRAAQGDIYAELLQHSFICAVTAVCRRDLVAGMDFDWLDAHGLKTVDYHLWLECAARAKVRYIDRSLATYRVRSTSVSNTAIFSARLAFVEKQLQTQQYFAARHPAAGFDYDRQCRRVYSYLFCRAVRAREWAEARRLWKWVSADGVLCALRQYRTYS